MSNSPTPGPFSCEVVETMRGITILQHLEPSGTLWATQGRNIIRRDSLSGAAKWETVAKFPFVKPRDFFGFCRLSVRASRADRANVFVNSSGQLIAIRNGTVYSKNQTDGSDGSGSLYPLQTINGDSVLLGSICESKDGWSYFGEYYMNYDRQPVRVWRVPPEADRVELAHEFPSKEIRHVHGVHQDPYDDGALWLTSGDYQNECYLFRSDDGFQSHQKFGAGGQLWRAVRLFFTPTHVCWITDSHIEQNYACRMDRKTGELEQGLQFPGSAWYGSQTDDGVYVAFTTVEEGPAIQRFESGVYVSDDGFHWSEAAVHDAPTSPFCFKKDGWKPYRVFKHGVISCPSGIMTSNQFLISGEGLVGLDGSSMMLRFSKQGSDVA